MENKNAISLIVLVITIIVMSILAATIIITLSNTNIISEANDAVEKTEAQQVEEMKALMLADGMLGKNPESQTIGDTTLTWDSDSKTVIEKTTKDGTTKVDTVTIPKDFYYVGGTKDTGLVISDNVADKELDKGKENVRRDLAGNQWVWVPVETPSSLYTTVDAGQALSGSTGVKTTKYTNSAIISGQTRRKPGATSGYREPDILTYSGYETDSDYDNYAKAGFSSLANMAENMKNDYEEMIASLEKYKGFYIGRYELTANGEKTGATQTCENGVNWYTLYKNCKTLAVGSKVKTRMIWGLQWDATCNWLANSDPRYSITDSSTWGNYKNNTADGHGTKQNTGSSESWKANNIYDFAGNCYEFTQEASSTNNRAGRGGYYNYSGSSVPASGRGSSIPTNTISYYGSRPTLYLIP